MGGAGVGGRRQEVALEAIERLDPEAQVRPLRGVRGLAVHLGRALLLILCRPLSGEHPERLMVRAAEHVCPEDRRIYEFLYYLVPRNDSSSGIKSTSVCTP